MLYVFPPASRAQLVFEKNVEHRSNAIYFKHYIFFPFPNGQRWNATGYEECAPGSARFHLNIYSRVSARGERDPVYISVQKSYCSPTFCSFCYAASILQQHRCSIQPFLTLFLIIPVTKYIIIRNTFATKSYTQFASNFLDEIKYSNFIRKPPNLSPYFKQRR